MTEKEFYTELETLGLFKVVDRYGIFYYLRQLYSNEDYTDQWILGNLNNMKTIKVFNFTHINESGFIRVEHNTNLLNYSEIISSIRKSIIDFKKCLNKYKLKEINKDFI